MKKHLLAAAAALTCTFAAISVSSAQTAVFSYNDGVGAPNAGTYTPGSSFTFAIPQATYNYHRHTRTDFAGFVCGWSGCFGYFCLSPSVAYPITNISTSSFSIFLQRKKKA